MTAAERFWFYVEVGSDADCWLWAADCFDNGYGKFWLDGKSRRAHRVAWTFTYGPIPRGMTIDHLCHNRDPGCDLCDACPHRRCVNPDHMELKRIWSNVSAGRGPSAENARKTCCKRGHPFDEVNTYIDRKGQRICRRCQRDRMRRRRAEVHAV